MPAGPPIDAPESRITDGVVALAPSAPADARTVLEWDADREIQHGIRVRHPLRRRRRPWLGWARAEIAAIADNAASRAVALKAGFRQEALLRSYAVFERFAPELGRRFDWAVYGRLATDA